MCCNCCSREGSIGHCFRKIPHAVKGGNTTYTHGSFRFAYNGVEEIQQIIPDLDAEELAMADFGTYPEVEFYDDLCRMTDYKTDPSLASILTSQSFEAMKWMTSHNVKFIPIYGRQAFKIDGKFKFWGGMVLETVGGGHGLVETLHQQAAKMGIHILYDAMATQLLQDDEGVYGVLVKHKGQTKSLGAKADHYCIRWLPCQR